MMEENYKVFEDDDKSLKLLGELFSSQTSLKIMKSLIRREMYVSEISNTLNIRVSLVLHHLKKLEKLGLLEITHRKIISKGKLHRFFRMIPCMIVLPINITEKPEF